ncbi:hypothetical protein [Blattabacterium cuenoti]|uniref:hypothetical protein n=1 Tax=Blattabacterium cuenoti TaxID=1653831 RepID=UPI00163CC909|nr:hypothetical protein [Blattabacterium cuenoti]
MKTSMKFFIPTIFLTLGFIFSCNDDVSSVGKENSDVNTTNVEKTSSIPPNPTTASSSSQPNPKIESHTNSSETPPDTTESSENNPQEIEIIPYELSQKLQEVGSKIKELEKESKKHYDEYYQMVDLQKGILNEIVQKKIMMRSHTNGSLEQIKAQKELDDQKKLGKEKLQILKEKNILLNKLIKSITKIKNERLALQKQKEDYLNNQKEQKEKEQKEKEQKEKEQKEKEQKEKEQKN